MATSTQFNFELPEEEANLLLDVGVARKMGLTRETVMKAMVARALVLERLEQIAPKGTPASAEQREILAKVGIALQASPAFRRELKALLKDTPRIERGQKTVAVA